MRNPEVPGKRAAVDSGRAPRSSGGKSRSHRKRHKGKTVPAEGSPCLTERLDIEEYREQQRVERDEKLVRRAQDIADDQERKVRASRKSCSGRRRSTGGGVGCLSFVAHRSRRPSPEAVASASLGRHQPRPRKELCGQASCGWAPSATGVKYVACPGEVVHAATVALCAA